jgi:hypothetical protein
MPNIATSGSKVVIIGIGVGGVENPLPFSSRGVLYFPYITRDFTIVANTINPIGSIWVHQ